MKTILGCAAAGAMICSAGAVYAQNFTYEIVFEPVDAVGGLDSPNGRQYYGGSVSGTYVTTFADGSEGKGSVKCVGTGQPHGSIFAVHLACTATGERGGKTNIAYGCNYLGEPGPETPLGCVGGIQGKDADGNATRGSVTLEWYTDENARGTGQWYGAE